MDFTSDVVILGKKMLKDFNKAYDAHFLWESHKKLICTVCAQELEAVRSGYVTNWIIDNGSDIDSSLINYANTFNLDLDLEIPEEKKEETPATPTEATEKKSELPVNLNELFELLEGCKQQIQNELEGKMQAFMKEHEEGKIIKVSVVNPEGKKTDFNEITHEKFETVLKLVANNIPVFLTGGAGTGKNVLCKQVAEALGLKFYFTNAVTQEYKITGYSDAMGKYLDTQFYNAFKYGGLFMLDEMDASCPEALIILNSAIANGYFDFPRGKDRDGNEVGGYTECHKDFRVISAGNTYGLGADTEYVGRNQLDGATLNRFAMVKIDYDKRIEINCANGDNELVDFARAVRSASVKCGIRMVISYRDISRVAKMMQIMDLSEVLEMCMLKGLGADDMQCIYANVKALENKYTRALHKCILNCR